MIDQDPSAKDTSIDKSKRVLPPVYFLGAILAMAALHTLFPIARIFPSIVVLGIAVVLIGMVLILWAARLFGKAGTPIKPFQESSQLVVAGPYRWTRNPMYLGMMLILIGIGLTLGTLTPFVVPPVFAWLIREKFIVREEAMLEKRFGSLYAGYKKRIHRWL